MSTNVLDYGADPTGVADSQPAFVAAIDASGPPNSKRGGRIDVPTYKDAQGVWRPATYRMASDLVVQRGVQIVGEGGSVRHWATRMLFEPGKGLVFEGVTASNPTAEDPRADDALLSDVCVYAQPGHTGRGIYVRCRVHLHRVGVIGFRGQGIEVFASQNEVPPRNANTWSMSGVQIENCGVGLYVHGSDSNQGYVEQLQVISCTAQGILDSSYLGTTYVGCIVDACVGRSYEIVGGTNATVLLQCYAESGQPKALLGTLVAMFGGNITRTGPGYDVESGATPLVLVDGASNSRGFEVRKREGAGGSFDVRAGLGIGADTGLRLRVPGEQALSVRREQLLADAQHYTIGGPSPGALAVRADLAEAVWARLGIFLGAGTNRRKHTSDVEPTAPGAQGDVVWNRNPVAGGPSGWMYTPTGWKVIGTLPL